MKRMSIFSFRNMDRNLPQLQEFSPKEILKMNKTLSVLSVFIRGNNSGPICVHLWLNNFR